MLSALILFAAGAVAGVAEPPPQAAEPAPQGASYGPGKDGEVRDAAGPVPPAECKDDASSTADTRTIVVCAQRPNGYRINPDVLAAMRAKKSGKLHDKPKPRENYAQDNCATVGPMGCRGGQPLDVVSAAIAAGQLAVKALQGENVGKMLVTDEHSTEYQLYQLARQEREARELAARADKAKAKLKAEKAAKAADDKLDATSDD